MSYPAFRTPVTEAILKKLYKEFNREYFDNYLPELDRLWINNSARRFLGRAHLKYRYSGTEFEPYYRIEVCKAVINDRKVLVDVLLHEMIHIWQYKKYQETGDDIYLDKSDQHSAHGQYFQREMRRLNRMGFRINTKGGKDTVTEFDDYVYGLAVYPTSNAGSIGLFTIRKPKSNGFEQWKEGIARRMGIEVSALEMFKTKTNLAGRLKHYATFKSLPYGPKVFYSHEFTDEILEDRSTVIMHSEKIDNNAASKYRGIIGHKVVQAAKDSPFHIFLLRLFHAVDYGKAEPVIPKDADLNTKIDGIPQEVVELAYKEWSDLDYKTVSNFRGLDTTAKHLSKFALRGEPVDYAQETLDQLYVDVDTRLTKKEFGAFFVKRTAYWIKKRWPRSVNGTEATELAELLIERTDYL